MTDKFEQLLEFVVNDEMDKANELFHSIVVEKSRQIYEGLISSEAEEVGNDDVDSLIDAISDDEGAIAEEGDDVEEVPGEEGDKMPPMDGELDAPAGEADADDFEAKIDDIADALAQLKAQFADMAAGLGDEADHEEMPMADTPAPGEEAPTEESVLEYKEAAPKPVLTDSPGNGTSTVAKKNPMDSNGANAKNLNQGSNAEKGRPAPKVGSLTSANTEFDLKKVSAPSNKA